MLIYANIKTMAKRIWIFGIGRFGNFVASEILDETDLSLALVDKDEAKLSRFNNRDIPLHVCDAEIAENVVELEIDKNDFCLVLMSSDVGASTLVTQNLIDCQIDINHIFVRVINPQHRKILQHLGIAKFIDPDRMIAHKIIMDVSKKVELTYFDSNNYIFKLKNEKVDGVKIQDLTDLQKHKINVLLIFPGDNTQKTESVIHPSGKTVLKKGDQILLLAPKKGVSEANRIFCQ